MADAHVETESLWLPTDQTLATGIRVTTITVTTTHRSLDYLLNAAVSGRTSLPGRRKLILRNLDSTNPFYITESATQTDTDGWDVQEGADISFDASPTFTGNVARISDVDKGGGGFYLVCDSGTISVKVLEAK